MKKEIWYSISAEMRKHRSRIDIDGECLQTIAYVYIEGMLKRVDSSAYFFREESTEVLVIQAYKLYKNGIACIEYVGFVQKTNISKGYTDISRVTNNHCSIKDLLEEFKKQMKGKTMLYDMVLLESNPTGDNIIPTLPTTLPSFPLSY